MYVLLFLLKLSECRRIHEKNNNIHFVFVLSFRCAIKLLKVVGVFLAIYQLPLCLQGMNDAATDSPVTMKRVSKMNTANWFYATMLYGCVYPHRNALCNCVYFFQTSITEIHSVCASFTLVSQLISHKICNWKAVSSSWMCSHAFSIHSKCNHEKWM